MLEGCGADPAFFRRDEDEFDHILFEDGDDDLRLRVDIVRGGRPWRWLASR